MVRNLVGRPVTGTDFFDRRDEIDEIWDLLHRDHLLLLAPRRVGKTSLMERLLATAPQRGIRAAYTSVADAEDEIRFVQRLLDAVSKLDTGSKVLANLKKSPAGKVLKRVRKIGVGGVSLDLEAAKTRWAEIGEALATSLKRQQGPWLLLVDEIPMFVLNLLRQDPSAGSARKFLSWFRNLRQRPDLRGGVHWLLAGSIGLDAVTARLNLGDTINDLHILHLGPFSASTADDLLRELGTTEDLPLSEEVRDHMIRRVGWLIPYHLQLLFAHLRSHCHNQKCEPSVNAVDSALEDLLSPAHKAYFDYWRQRLRDELGKPDAGFALDLLASAAQDENGVELDTLEQVLRQHVHDPHERADKLRFLLDVLEADGYVVKDNGRFRFRSPLVREFWLRRVLP